MRTISNKIALYTCDSGRQWRQLLPKKLGSWISIPYYFIHGNHAMRLWRLEYPPECCLSLREGQIRFISQFVRVALAPWSYGQLWCVYLLNPLFDGETAFTTFSMSWRKKRYNRLTFNGTYVYWRRRYSRLFTKTTNNEPSQHNHYSLLYNFPSSHDLTFENLHWMHAICDANDIQETILDPGPSGATAKQRSVLALLWSGGAGGPVFTGLVASVDRDSPCSEHLVWVLDLERHYYGQIMWWYRLQWQFLGNKA